MSLSPQQDLSLAYKLLPAWSEYVPYPPWPKQVAFCMLPHREALYGGAAGGGKSDALLMSALMYAHVPYYSAIIFRRSLADLQQAEGLLTRAFEWFNPYPEIKYVPSQHCFVFPSGARLAFGYIGAVGSYEHYQGAAYQFIGWDELTQHDEWFYKEMMSRLRRRQCNKHGGRVIAGKPSPLPYDSNCTLCRMYAPLANIPLRVRSTSNPGGRGHVWVKKRFLIHRDKLTGEWKSGVPDRPFIPATFLDNPALDYASYEKNLDELDEARREQLKHGDWDKLATGRYKSEWFRKYLYTAGYYVILNSETGAREESFHQDRIRIFTVVDVACSVRTGVADVGFYKGREPSWTVIGTFGITPNNKLLVLEVIRFQQEVPYLFPQLKDVVERWKPVYVGMDATGVGLPIAQLAAGHGIPVKELVTTFDKIANSSESLNHAKAGRIHLPEEASWLEDFTGELTCWTGHPHDTDDQVDVLSNAGHEYTLLAGNMTREGVIDSHMTETPGVGKYTSDLLTYQDQTTGQGAAYPSAAYATPWSGITNY